MNKSKVAIVRCKGYEDELVYNSIKRGIDLLGGVLNFAKPGEKMVLKPNVLVGADPAKAVTTHPIIFKAVGRIFKEAGTRVYFGDSPSFGGCESNMRRAGLMQVADDMGFVLADFDHGKEVSHNSALLNKRFVLANGILESDGVISLPKMKTHGLTRFTGAVKNQFGCIPGILKGQFHVKMSNPYDFATMLVDINTFIHPRLYIIDGIIAMEGNGPRNGKPRAMNVLLFSADPIAIDSIACKIIDLNPEFVPTSKPGEKASLGTYHYENIDVIGDDIESFIVKDFDVVKKPPIPTTDGTVRTFLKNQLTPRPVINTTKCTGCGTCIKICPVGATALDWMHHEAGKPPKHVYKNCIRCFCCQETCPEGAITIKSPILGKVIFRG